EKILHRDSRRRRHVEKRGDRREEVYALDLTREPAGRDPGTGEHDWNVEQLVIEMDAVLEETVLLEFLAVVTEDDDHRRVGDAEGVQAVEQRAECRIPVADLEPVERADVRQLVRSEALPDSVAEPAGDTGDVSRGDRGSRVRRWWRRRRRGVRVVRLHVVEIAEEALAAVRAQPAEERRIDLGRRRPRVALPIPARLDERLEPAREVRCARDDRIGR